MTEWAELVAPKSTAVLNGHTGYGHRARYEWTVEYPAEQPITKIPILDEDGDEIGATETPAPWWDESFVGFRAKVLVNPTGAEIRNEQVMHTKLIRKQITEDDYLEAVAYRVAEWDVYVVGPDGEREDIPAPGPGGWERFLDLPNMLMSWLTMEIRFAHLPKVMKSLNSRPSGGTGSAAPNAPPATSETTPPPS